MNFVEQEGYTETFIQAQTGQGKSYAAMKFALEQACIKNGRVIFSVSSLVLVDQVYREIFNLKETLCLENTIYLKDVSVNIEKHTSYETLQPGKSLSLFERGNCIIITVHQYLKEIDDNFTVTTFYCLLIPFIKQTFIIVDEGNLFLNDVTKRVLVEESVGVINNQWVRLQGQYQLNKMDIADKFSLKTRGFNFLESTNKENNLVTLKLDRGNSLQENIQNVFEFDEKANSSL